MVSYYALSPMHVFVLTWQKSGKLTAKDDPGIVIFDNFALEAIDLVMGFSNRIIHVLYIAYTLYM